MQPSPLDIVVVMPVHNEEACVEQVATEWLDALALAAPGRSLLLVVDDGSTDRSAIILTQLTRTRPHIRVVSKKQGGHGETIALGYKLALEFGPDWVFQTDSDGEIPASEFARLWSERDGSPFILAERQQRKEGWMRRFVTRGVRTLLWFGWGCDVPDPNVPFRLMRADALGEFLRIVPPGVFAPNVYLSLLARERGVDVRNVPVVHRGRETGAPSLVNWRLLSACVRSTRELIAFRYAR